MVQYLILDASSGAEKLNGEIGLLAPQVPSTIRDFIHKIRCLQLVLLPVSRAQNSIAQVSAIKMDFNNFYVSRREPL